MKEEKDLVEATVGEEEAMAAAAVEEVMGEVEVEAEAMVAEEDTAVDTGEAVEKEVLNEIAVQCPSKKARKSK
jgi:hypothetical protein